MAIHGNSDQAGLSSSQFGLAFFIAGSTLQLICKGRNPGWCAMCIVYREDGTAA